MISLCKTVISKLKENNSNFKKIYEKESSITSKIEKLVTEIYGGKKINYSEKAINSIEKITKMWYETLPICMAKTPVSFSSNPKLLWVPKDFDFDIENVELSAWAWFIVVISWSVMRMPGLPETPNYENIFLNPAWEITWIR